MWIAKVKGEWYEVKDVIDQGPGKGNHYDLVDLGIVHQDEIEDLDIRSTKELTKTSLLNARKAIQAAEEKVPPTSQTESQPESKAPFNIQKARSAAPKYWRDLDLNKYLSKVQSIIGTNEGPNTDAFYEAVYRYQQGNPEITLKDGILGPETLSAMIKQDSSLAKEFQVSQAKSFNDFLSKNEELAQQRGSDFNLDRFKNKIGRVESGGKYDATSPFTSATGKYQFIWSIWAKPISQHFGRLISREEFLNDPKLQEGFMDYYVKTNLVPSAVALQKRFPKVASKLTFEQLLGLIHFKGPGDAAKILAGLPDPTTKNNLSVTQYLAKLV